MTVGRFLRCWGALVFVVAFQILTGTIGTFKPWYLFIWLPMDALIGFMGWLHYGHLKTIDAVQNRIRIVRDGDNYDR